MLRLFNMSYFSDKEIHIEKLKHIAPAVLKRLFAK